MPSFSGFVSIRTESHDTILAPRFSSPQRDVGCTRFPPPFEIGGGPFPPFLRSPLVFFSPHSPHHGRAQCGETYWFQDRKHHPPHGPAFSPRIPSPLWQWASREIFFFFPLAFGCRTVLLSCVRWRKPNDLPPPSLFPSPFIKHCPCPFFFFSCKALLP